MLSPSWRPRVWPCVFAVALGIAGARAQVPTVAGWACLAAGTLPLALGGWRKWQGPSAAWVFAACALCACLGLGLLRGELAGHAADDSIARLAGPQPCLLRVSGTVTGEPETAGPDGGEFAVFSRRTPVERFQLAVSGVVTDGGDALASGMLAVSRPVGGAAIHAGDRIEMLGWLSALKGPQNPGEFDMRGHLMRKGVVARFAAGQVTVARAAGFASPARLRAQVAKRAGDSLLAGLHADKPARTTLLSALLLGARGGEGQAELWRDFQHAGLAHVLAISGANVGIFLLGVWWLGRLASGRPARVAVGVLAVIFLFLLVVPDDTPVLRAGAMAALLAVAYGLGRPVPGLFALGASALLLLLWRPMELFSPGFQLTFAAVGALFLFTRPMTDKLEIWLTGRLPIENAERLPLARRLMRKALRLALEGAVASTVVFLAVLPILMLHFDAVSPLAAVFSLFAAPVAALLMWVGYAKIALGLLCMPLGALLAYPAEWCADALAAIVHFSAHLPGAQVALVKPASLGMCAAALAGIWVALAWWCREEAENAPVPLLGRRRRLPSKGAGAGLLFLALSGLVAEQVHAYHLLRSPPGLRLHALAVGDGSCFVLETSERALMFDCGSRTLAHPGERVAVPALRRLGVRSLDALIVSHADLDHFNGALEVADAIGVRAAYLGPSVWAEGTADANSTSGVLLAGLRARGIACHPILRGWRMEMGPGAHAEALWPTAQTAPTDSRNNQSVVLRACQGSRRLLLAADLEADGMRNLFKVERDLKAEVADLPHHGGFVAESPRWLAEVAPLEVIQSSSLARFESENSRQWTPLLERANVRRQVTGESGWVRVVLQETAGGEK